MNETKGRSARWTLLLAWVGLKQVHPGLTAWDGAILVGLGLWWLMERRSRKGGP